MSTKLKMRPLFLAFNFLTRLAPAFQAKDEEVSESLTWFPLAGLTLGLILAFPFYCGLLDYQFQVQAWLILTLNWVLTRGLHWDGLADVCDGWASGKTGEEFWAVVKDSRCGSFGMMAMLLAGIGYVQCMSQALAQAGLGIVVWSCLLGRLAPMGLGRLSHKIARPGLGRSVIEGSLRPFARYTHLLALLVGLYFVPFRVWLLSLLLSAAAVYALYLLGRNRHGVNGDFLGAAVIMAELAAPLAAVVIMPVWI